MVAVIVAGSGLVGLSAGRSQATNLTLNDVRNCNDNAIIYCGGMTPSEIHNKYYSNNSRYANIQATFSAFGISAGDINSLGSNAQAGLVNKNGDVSINGKVVATNAVTAGRQNMAGSTAKTVPASYASGNFTFYERKPSVSFQQNSLQAFVVMKNGQFQYAILASCGNPIIATPKQSTPPPAPVAYAACVSLTAEKTATPANSYQFSAAASVKNATINSYSFDFGDNTNQVVTSSATSTNASHTYAQPGSYSAKLTLNVTENGQAKMVTSKSCAATINIAQPQPKCSVSGKTNLPANSPQCQQAPPAYAACASLTSQQVAAPAHAYQFSAAATTKNAAINSYNFDFGDGNNQVVTSNATSASTKHSYLKPGSYNATVTINSLQNGQAKALTSANCSVTITIAQPTPPTPPKPQTPTPPSLPNTGPGAVIGVFAGTSLIGSLAAGLWLKRR
ncbi:MAG: PKD domain-containing protein [Candidatus Saccharimonadales bacterium]